MSPEQRILSYHDVLLRKADVDLLRGPHWLNDQVIAFFFEYLMREMHPNLSNAVALIPGSMSFLLLNSDPSEAAMIFEPLQLHKKALVVFAVNDNPDVELAAGGAHWSCLAYLRAINSFRHYDSAQPHNHSVAKSLAGAAAPLVRNRAAAAAAAAANSPGALASAHASYIEVDAAPQQRNSNDCGMYVLAVAQALCDSFAQRSSNSSSGSASKVHCSSQTSQQQLAETAAAAAAAGFTIADQGLSEEEEATILQQITPSSVAQMRSELLDLIQQLGKQEHVT